MLKRTVISAVLLVSFAYGSTLAQQVSPKPMTVTQILQGMSANIAGMSSFKVPVHIVAHVKKGMFSMPFPMDGDRYFKAPGRNALTVEKGGNAELVKALVTTYTLIGSPATWQQTHNITLQGVEDADGHHAYVLLATRKQPSKVDHLLLDVDTTTFDPVRGHWFISDGSTIIMHMHQGVVDGKYRLAQHDDVDFNLAKYHGSATLDYGAYAINVPVDDSVFAPAP